MIGMNRGYHTRKSGKKHNTPQREYWEDCKHILGV